MIRELINFTAKLSDDFKSLGSKPKEGLHILLKLKENGSVDLEQYGYEFYSKKQKSELSNFLNKCKELQQNAWCIDTNKCFDLPKKAIHTCSPFAVAFKKEHLEGGEKYIKNQTKGATQIYDRFEQYFILAFELLDEDKKQKYSAFKEVFIQKEFSQIIDEIETENYNKSVCLQNECNELENKEKTSTDKTEKSNLKKEISDIKEQLEELKPLKDASYILFYLDISPEEYKDAHNKYLYKRLFNTDEYNTEPNEADLTYGTNDFLNGFNSNKPFLLHHTSAFDITGRISNIDAKRLYDLKNIFSNKILPNPLPIFIYEEELQQKIFGLFREGDFKIAYRDILKKLFEDREDDISNYYLLFWQNERDGLAFKDFDYVAKFEYKLNNLRVENLFDIKEKGGKTKYYAPIQNIFDFEQRVFMPLAQNKYRRLDYFGSLSKDDYDKLNLTFISYSKYRKAIYDFVYKSQRNAINGNVFSEMTFNSIFDDIKNANEYGVKEKLNIWYSLYEYFNPNKITNMVNKLKEYQNFVSNLIADKETVDITDEKFAFAAGQVIYYILRKSKSEDNSYNLLEPYLQQARCSEFKKAIANDFARYKHANFSNDFKKVAAFVLSYETDNNLKHLLPQILSGVFAKNQLFSSNNSN